MPLTGLGSLITGTIAGGTFNINVQQNTSPKETEEHLKVVRKGSALKG